MTEPNTTTPPEGSTPPAGEPTPPTNPPQPDNATAAQLRIAQKRLAELEKAEEDRKKAEMTEAERYKVEAEEARREAETLKRENLIAKTATKAGLPPELWTRVQGSTAEEIEADVATLLGFVKPPAPAPAHTGQAPNNPPAPVSNPEKERLTAALKEAQNKGDVASMLKIKGQIAALK